MKKINIRIFAALFAVILCFAIFPATAFAGGGEEEIPLIPEETETPKPDPTPLTPDGNLTLVDDISEEQAEDKQFVTLVSKNGSYFYLVIDRAGDKENVYFLNLVDEADLLALIEGETPKQSQVPQVCNCTDLCEDGKVDPNCPLCKNDLTKCTGKTTTYTPAPEPKTTEEKSNSAGSTLLILLIVGIAGGGFYYFKVMKNKGNTKGNTILEEYDFEDEDEDEYEYEYEIEDENEESEDIQ